MTKELLFVIEHFPENRIKLIELYEQDQDFRQLCNDYCLSLNMLAAFRKTEPEYRKVENDYKQVSEDLEEELEQLIRKMK